MEIKRAIADKEVNTNFAEEIDDNVSVECRSIKPAPSDSWKCTASSDAAEDKLTVTLIVIYEYSRLKKKKGGGRVCSADTRFLRREYKHYSRLSVEMRRTRNFFEPMQLFLSFAKSTVYLLFLYSIRPLLILLAHARGFHVDLRDLHYLVSYLLSNLVNRIAIVSRAYQARERERERENTMK